jgi:glycine oxidase
VSERPDVVIIGGGVMGCATAYFLATRHGQRVLVLERDGVASGASGGAAGELGAVGRHRFSAEYTAFILRGIALQNELEAELRAASGIDYRLMDIPMLRPAFDDHEAAALREQMAWQRELGMQVDWYDERSVHTLGTWLAPEAIGGALTIERQLETYPFALALAGAAEQAGVRFRTAEVTGLLGDGVARGVRVGAEEIEAGQVLIASGPWAVHAGPWIGMDLPIYPLRGQIVHVDLPSGLTMPTHAIFHESGYVLPKAGGDLLVGTTQEEAGFDANPTMEAQNAIMESVGALAPAVLDAPIRDLTACLRPACRDELPVIGPVPGWEGLHLCTGHGYKGITLALVTGLHLAELMAQGASSLSLDLYSPARFTAQG